MALGAFDAQGVLAGARQVSSPNWDERPADAAIRLLVVHNISLPPRVVGHADIAPGRKHGTGPLCAWARFREAPTPAASRHTRLPPRRARRSALRRTPTARDSQRRTSKPCLRLDTPLELVAPSYADTI